MTMTIETNPTINEVLVEKLGQVKDVLNESGWCQGDYVNNRGHRCIYGALQVVDWDYQDMMAEALRANIDWDNSRLSSDGGAGLVAWNDAPSRRKRDVIRLIDRTIRNLSKDA